MAAGQVSAARRHRVSLPSSVYRAGADTGVSPPPSARRALVQRQLDSPSWGGGMCAYDVVKRCGSSVLGLPWRFRQALPDPRWRCTGGRAF
jgi:hypothetical protein